MALGKQVEDQLCIFLEKSGVYIEVNPTLDHDFKIDFVVHSIRSIVRRFGPVGVQVTTKQTDAVKLQKFLEESAKVVDRRMYLEMPEDIDRGALEGARSAILRFILDHEFLQKNEAVFQVYPDGTIRHRPFSEFFGKKAA